MAGCGGDRGGETADGETSTPTETTATPTPTELATPTGTTTAIGQKTPTETATYAYTTPTPAETTTPTPAETTTPTPAETTTPTPTTKTVEMENTTFNPAKAEVDVGATVTWVNRDGYSHDVTSAQFSDGAASWDFAKTVSGGESTTYTFENQGFYEYYCTIHGKGTMCGVIVVGGVSYTGSLPCQSDDGGGGY